MERFGSWEIQLEAFGGLVGAVLGRFGVPDPPQGSSGPEPCPGCAAHIAMLRARIQVADPLLPAVSTPGLDLGLGRVQHMRSMRWPTQYPLRL